MEIRPSFQRSPSSPINSPSPAFWQESSGMESKGGPGGWPQTVMARGMEGAEKQGESWTGGSSRPFPPRLPWL